MSLQFIEDASAGAWCVAPETHTLRPSLRRVAFMLEQAFVLAGIVIQIYIHVYLVFAALILRHVIRAEEMTQASRTSKMFLHDLIE